jgi:ligand-binding sensor domain-containing protein
VVPDGSVWFGRWESGVAHFDPASPEAKAWTTYTAADGLASDSIIAIAAAPDGSVWFGSDDDTYGVSHFDGETWTTYTTADGLANNEVMSIVVAPDGSVWFGTWEDGVSCYIPPD